MWGVKGVKESWWKWGDASGISILTSNKELYGGKLFYCYGNIREKAYTQP